MKGGFLLRYLTAIDIDGLPAGEGVFLACTLWLASALLLIDRRDDARVLFERVVGLCNDVGLLSEEYEPTSRRLLGNFPQALSHVSLIMTAFQLAADAPPHQG
jgi:GH15 family glucan-1,4-alpha-glucosidase